MQKISRAHEVGNDNILCRKLEVFGYKLFPVQFNAPMWHMKHEKTTPKIWEIRKKMTDLSTYTKEQWISKLEKLGNNWGIGQRIEIAMINYLREDKLIKCLNNIINKTKMPLYITLMLQNYENIDKSTLEKIEEVLNKFASYSLIKSEGNLGTGKPRYLTTSKTLKNKADYTLIIDSDMMIEQWTIEALYKKISEEKNYSAISCWCRPNYFKYKLLNNCLQREKLIEGFYETDAMGTGCVIVKTECFKNAKFNENLFIGFIDFIWCMEMRKYNYRLGIMCDKNYYILNDNSANTQEYNKSRQNKEEIQKSREFVKNTYGIYV